MFYLKGFYGVYDEVFKTLAEEDRQFMDDEDFLVYDFGDSKSVYEEVCIANIDVALVLTGENKKIM